MIRREIKIIREYKNSTSTEDLIRRLIRIHFNNVTKQTNKGCSDHEVQNYEK